MPPASSKRAAEDAQSLKEKLHSLPSTARGGGGRRNGNNATNGSHLKDVMSSNGDNTSTTNETETAGVSRSHMFSRLTRAPGADASPGRLDKMGEPALFRPARLPTSLPHGHGDLVQKPAQPCRVEPGHWQNVAYVGEVESEEESREGRFGHRGAKAFQRPAGDGDRYVKLPARLRRLPLFFFCRGGLC